jgi:hypothetical protein
MAKKGKKAQAEALGDILAYFIIAVVLAFMIVVAILMPKIGLASLNNRQENNLLNHQIESSVYSFLRQPQTDGVDIIEKLRAGDEQARKDLQNELDYMCSLNGVDCSFVFHSGDVADYCQEMTIGAGLPTRNLCILVPGKELSALEIQITGGSTDLSKTPSEGGGTSHAG